MVKKGYPQKRHLPISKGMFTARSRSLSLSLSLSLRADEFGLRAVESRRPAFIFWTERDVLSGGYLGPTSVAFIFCLACDLLILGSLDRNEVV